MVDVGGGGGGVVEGGCVVVGDENAGLRIRVWVIRVLGCCDEGDREKRKRAAWSTWEGAGAVLSRVGVLLWVMKMRVFEFVYEWWYMYGFSRLFHQC